MNIILDKRVGKFILSLEETTRAEIDGMTALLGQYGFALEMPFSKRLQKDLWELRIKGNQAVRIFYTIQGDVAILFHAFLKKSQKTPRHELAMAFKRLQYYKAY